MTKKLYLAALFVVSILTNSAFVMAQNKVVVIPLSGDDLKPLANVITVAKENGDFVSPLDAMNSISDASETNPYLIVMAPGVYELGTSALFMKPFVSVAGSGPNITVIKGTGSKVINMADDTFIQDLSVIQTNTSTSTQSVIDAFSSDRAIIDNVHALLENDVSSVRRVILVRLSDPTIIRNSFLEVAGSVAGAYGIFSSGLGPDILVSNTIISLPNSADDPINFGQGGTLEAICDSVSFISGVRSFNSRVLLDEFCGN